MCVFVTGFALFKKSACMNAGKRNIITRRNFLKFFLFFVSIVVVKPFEDLNRTSVKFKRLKI